jgi:hypothetical protein
MTYPTQQNDYTGNQINYNGLYTSANHLPKNNYDINDGNFSNLINSNSANSNHQITNKVKKINGKKTEEVKDNSQNIKYILLGVAVITSIFVIGYFFSGQTQTDGGDVPHIDPDPLDNKINETDEPTHEINKEPTSEIDEPNEIPTSEDSNTSDLNNSTVYVKSNLTKFDPPKKWINQSTKETDFTNTKNFNDCPIGPYSNEYGFVEKDSYSGDLNPKETQPPIETQQDKSDEQLQTNHEEDNPTGEIKEQNYVEDEKQIVPESDEEQQNKIEEKNTSELIVKQNITENDEKNVSDKVKNSETSVALIGEEYEEEIDPEDLPKGYLVSFDSQNNITTFKSYLPYLAGVHIFGGILFATSENYWPLSFYSAASYFGMSENYMAHQNGWGGVFTKNQIYNCFRDNLRCSEIFKIIQDVPGLGFVTKVQEVLFNKTVPILALPMIFPGVNYFLKQRKLDSLNEDLKNFKEQEKLKSINAEIKKAKFEVKRSKSTLIKASALSVGSYVASHWIIPSIFRGNFSPMKPIISNGAFVASMLSTLAINSNNRIVKTAATTVSIANSLFLAYTIVTQGAPYEYVAGVAASIALNYGIGKAINYYNRSIAKA